VRRTRHAALKRGPGAAPTGRIALREVRPHAVEHRLHRAERSCHTQRTRQAGT
jgi:hypothetical protein